MKNSPQASVLIIGHKRRIVELKLLANTLLDELGRDPRFKSPDVLEATSSLVD